MESPDSNNGRQEQAPGAIWRLAAWLPRIASLAFGAVWLSGVIAMGAFIVGGIYQELRKPLAYQPVEAAVTAYNPPVRKVDEFGDDASAAGRVRYTYTVAGEQYEGTHYLPASPEADSASEANARGSLPGGKLAAWYDPADPADSTLSPTAEPHLLGFLIFLMPFLAVGVAMIFYGLTGKGASFRPGMGRRTGGKGLSVSGGGGYFAAYFILSAVCAFGYFGLCGLLDWKTAWVIGAMLLLVVVPGASLLIGRYISRRKKAPALLPGEQPAAPSSAAAEAAEVGVPPTMPGVGGKLGTMIFFSLFWCGITGVFVVIAVGSLVKQREAARRFVAGDGVVIASKVKTHEGDSDSGPTYEALVKYQYEVSSRQYTSSRYAYGMASSSNRQEAQRIVAAHPPGRKIKVWYDPEDPAESVLQLAVPTINYFLLLFLQPFVMVGAGLIGYTIWIPIARARAQRFMDQPDPLFGDIPGWGSARQDVRGTTIHPQRNPLRVLYGFVAGYGATCFVSIFVIAFLLEGFEGGSPKPIFTAFYIACGVGVAAMLLALVRPAGKAVLTIDASLGQLTLTSPKRDLTVPFDDIDKWTIRIVADPNGTKVNDTPLTRPLLSVVARDGQSHPIRLFGTGDEMPFVARKVGKALAELTAGCLTELAADSPKTTESTGPEAGLLDLLRHFKKLRQQSSSRKDYKDIMP